jgi:hypothetical protein
MGVAGSSGAEVRAEGTAGTAAAGGGITANLVASIRSFLPMSKPAPAPPAAGTKKPPQKVNSQLKHALSPCQAHALSS